MAEPFIVLARASLSFLLVVVACRGEGAKLDKTSRTSLPPVFSLGPANSTNWDPSAGPVILVALGEMGDSAAVVLPDVTDTTMDTLNLRVPQISERVFDLYGRSGKLGSSAAGPFREAKTSDGCDAWPSVRLRSAHQGWQVAFASGAARAIPLDSIESLSSADSASLAASLAETVATLSIASDPTFRRLPFRVRYAYATHSDSIEIVVADIVRALNEEANPRIEHIFLVGERPADNRGKFTVGYYSRTAGAEEKTQATEVLAALAIGSSRRPGFVINVASDEGARFGLIERTGPAEWRPLWWSAYTGC